MANPATDQLGSFQVAPPLIALVEDDAIARRYLRTWLEESGFSVVEHGALHELDMRSAGGLSALCFGLSVDDASRLHKLRELHAAHAALPVLVVGAERAAAAAAMHAGAWDYVQKPLVREAFLHAIARAVEHHRLLERVRQLEDELAHRKPFAPTEIPAVVLDVKTSSAPAASAQAAISPDQSADATSPPLAQTPRPVRTVRELERMEIGRAMAATSANVTLAAKLLGIGRATLYRKLAQFHRTSAIAAAAADCAPFKTPDSGQ